MKEGRKEGMDGVRDKERRERRKLLLLDLSGAVPGF